MNLNLLKSKLAGSIGLNYCRFCGENNSKIHFCKTLGLNIQDPRKWSEEFYRNLLKEVQLKKPEEYFIKSK